MIIVVYGMSTEGYDIARQMAIEGSTVYIIDESNSSALLLNKEIARTYPNVMAIKEDEPIMPLEPLNDAVSKADYLFFAPRIRTRRHNVKSDMKSLFRDATTSLKRGASVVFCVPVGIGENGDNITVLEHVTGLSVDKQASYYYYPLEDDYSAPVVIGSVDAKENQALSEMLSTNPKKPKKFVSLSASEYLHASDIVARFSRVYGALELGTSVRDDETRAQVALHDRVIKDLYIDEMVNGVLDMWMLDLSAEETKQMVRLLVLYTKALDLYIKHMIESIKQHLREYGIRPSRTKTIVMWSYDPSRIRGDKNEMCDLLVKRLCDNLGDTETYEKPGQWTFDVNRFTILLPCSQKDFEHAIKVKKTKPNSVIIVKANHLCEMLA